MQKRSIAEAAFKLTLRDFEQAAERISKDVFETSLIAFFESSMLVKTKSGECFSIISKALAELL